jgi:hypothetical protein
MVAQQSNRIEAAPRGKKTFDILEANFPFGEGG